MATFILKLIYPPMISCFCASFVPLRRSSHLLPQPVNPSALRMQLRHHLMTTREFFPSRNKYAKLLLPALVNEGTKELNLIPNFAYTYSAFFSHVQQDHESATVSFTVIPNNNGMYNSQQQSSVATRGKNNFLKCLTRFLQHSQTLTKDCT